MSSRSRQLVLLCVVCAVTAGSVSATPDLTNGLSVLYLLSDPYAANAVIWATALDRRGYDVTKAGTKDAIRALDGVGPSIHADLILDAGADVTEFDAVFVTTRSVDPTEIANVGRDLRSSAAALDLLRDADEAGLAMYVGASGFGVLIDAGLVSGRSVLCHTALINDCQAAGGLCAPSRAWVTPFRDGNLVTGTSWYSFPIENVEEIGRALDATQTYSRSLGALVGEDPAWTHGSAALDLPVERADTWGGGRNDGAVAVCALAEGYALTGYTFSGASGTADMLAVRCDNDGELLWKRVFGGPGRDYGEAICATQDGGCVVAGFTTSAGSGGEDALLVRYAADGSVSWVKTFGGNAADMALGVCSTRDGGFAFCGYTMSEGAGGSDHWIVRVDGDGNVLWAAELGTERNERAYDIAEEESGDFVVLASASTTRGSYDSQLLRLDGSGQLVASIPVAWASQNVLEDFVLSMDGSVLAVGYEDSVQTEAVGVVAASFGVSPTLRAAVWARRAEWDDAFNYGAAVLEVGGGDLWICGTASSADPMETDTLFMRLSRAGYVEWSATRGAADRSERLEDACRLATGGVVAVGHSQSAAGDQDVLVVFVDPEWAP